MSGAFAGVDLNLVLAACGGLAFVIVLAFAARAAFGGRRDEVIERLERGTQAFDLAPIDESAPEKTLARIASVLRPLARLAKPTEGEELSRLNQTLIHAGYRGDSAVEVYLGVKLIVPLLLLIGLWQINIHLETPIEFPLDVSVAVISAAVAFFLPNLWLSGKIGERRSAIERALPDAMDLLVTCVEAGLGLDAAMARVSQEMEMVSPILALEMKQTLLEIQAGVRRADAFHRLWNRTGVEDLRSLSAMIIQTELFGTSVSRALRVHSDGMRTKRMQHAEEKAAMVSVKMTVPLILCILPALMAIVIGPAAVMIQKTMGGQ